MSPSVNGNLEPGQFDGRLFPTVVAIIVIGLAALAWEWRHAHTPAVQPRPANAWPVQAEVRESRTATEPPGNVTSAQQ